MGETVNSINRYCLGFTIRPNVPTKWGHPKGSCERSEQLFGPIVNKARCTHPRRGWGHPEGAPSESESESEGVWPYLGFRISLPLLLYHTRIDINCCIHLSCGQKRFSLFPANPKFQILNNIEYQNPNDKNSEAFFDNAPFRIVCFEFCV